MRVATLTEVSGLALEREVVEVQGTAADGTYVVERLPGRRRPGEVLVTRALTDDRAFEHWVRDPSDGPGAGHGAVTIVVSTSKADRSRRTPWPRPVRGGSRSSA